MKSTHSQHPQYNCDICDLPGDVLADPCGNVVCPECHELSFLLAIKLGRIDSYGDYRRVLNNIQINKPQYTLDQIHTLSRIGEEMTSQT